MHQISQINVMQEYRAELKGSVGFVPTMGALHAGHLSLIKQAVEENDYVIVSIFVNPTQFDQAADLDKYPNTIEDDLKIIEEAGVVAVFLPNFEKMYPDNYAYKIIENSLSLKFCGAHRPGHFDGVLSVVMKLLNVVQANNAYFGEKDYQQLQLIKGMANAFFMSVNIIGCPTIREADGLAMSSRNLRLDGVQRKIAPQFYATLINHDSLKDKQNQLEGMGFEVDYLDTIDGRLLAAVYLGDIRLIDNVPYASSETL